MAKLQSKKESSPDFICRRMLQEVENTLEEAEEGHKKSLEKQQPNLECNVCFVRFSAKRKRACLDPCGHTGPCMNCGVREWKRWKACSLCQRHTLKP